jgi:hypothetical protein
MGHPDSGRPPRARRLVLRKIARPLTFPVDAPSPGPPPSRVRPPSIPPPLPRLPASSPPARNAGATIKPPPPVRSPSASHSQLDDGDDIYRPALASPTVDAAVAHSVTGSLPPVAATLPPGVSSPPLEAQARRGPRKWALAALPGLGVALAAVIVATVMAGRRDSHMGPAPATAAIPPTTAMFGLALPDPRPASQSPPSIDLLPETSVEALPKAPTTARPVGGGRRFVPVVAPAPRPIVRPGIDPAVAARAEPDSDEDEDSPAPVTAPSIPPPIDPLVKAVRDDIDEDEARHK